MTTKKEIEVSKEADELMTGLAKLVTVIKASLADGFQIGSDMPAIVLAAVAELPVAIMGLDQLPAEVTAETPAFIRAAFNGGGEILIAALAKAPAPAA